MILDYSYNKYNKKLDMSYVDDNGMKQIVSFNCSRFKSYYSTPTGRFNNWQGDKCDIKWVENPSKFDIKTYIEELDQKYKSLFSKRMFPKVYTFDIETRQGPNGEFPEPDEAKYEITNISICSPNLNTVVLGTLQMSDDETRVFEENYANYLGGSSFFKSLNLPQPYVKYVRFNSEEEMLKHFLTNIVAKVPILTGWNCVLFDWQYIVNRIRNHYPALTIKSSSCTFRCAPKQYENKYGDKITLPMPEHTLIIDMMDVIENEDKKVLPMKESMKLGYISRETINMDKIEYDGSLDDLYRNDYGRYVFYNSVDSALVQLINYRFKVLDHIYLYALYCNEKISSCFSKIALTEALVFKDFTEQGLKVVYEERVDIQRERLIGAYVKKPWFGIWEFVCCNDFASLYPSTIRSCNLSFENYVGAFWDEDRLRPYRIKHDQYIVVGPNVYKMDGTPKHPRLGDYVATYLNEAALKKYRADKNYFVSINGCVYRNDKDYAFKRIQGKLKATRDHDKYMSKELDAIVMSDVDNKANSAQKYPAHIIEHLESMGYKITCAADLADVDIAAFRRELDAEITYLGGNEQAMKLMMNSMYGGASHVSFYWYNMNLANDITGESRNLTQMMEHHIPDFMRKNWMSLTDVHRELGISLDKKHCEEVLAQEIPPFILDDPAAYHKSSFITPVYGDSVTGDTKIMLSDGTEKTIESLYNECGTAVVNRGKDFAITDIKVRNFNGHEYVNSNIKYIIRHKTSKGKWLLCTNNGLNVTVTADHSLISFNSGRLLKTKPSDMTPGTKLVTVNGITTVKSCECIGEFNDEYVYDISIDTDKDNMQNFFGNGILVHNTDSVDKDTIIHTENGDMTIEELYNRNAGNILITQNGHELVASHDKVLNWNGELKYDNINYVMRHKVKKAKWRIKTKSGKEVIVTNDHSMIVFRDGVKTEVKPYEILKTDKILYVNIDKWAFSNIETCECIGEFEDEYVYDIEVADNSHTFIANDMLVHNSIYSSYENLLYSIKDSDKMTIEQKRDLIVKFNTGFLDHHNREFIKEYYDKRHGQSVHNFELETVSRSGVWLDVKKHYSQLLMWKDGKVFDTNHLKMKTTGLEMNKASHPRLAREILSYIIRYMLENAGDKNLIFKLNIELQKWRDKWNKANVDDVSANINVNGYNKYVLDDRSQALSLAPKCPSSVRAMANYNHIKNTHRVSGENLYTGKMKLYEFRHGREWDYFAYQAMALPSWANNYAPIDRTHMFDKYVITPLNRIIEPAGMPALTVDGNIQMSLF